jgi:initiation factor 1A
MPNIKGGKAYRSGKHADVKSILHDICWDQGQAPARVLKHLGDRNVMLYCNDNKERIGHIRGGLSKKKAMIEVGDIVLYSNRADGLGSTSVKERADILEKYNHDIIHDLKKQPFVNPKLFLQLERRTELTGIIKPDEAFEFDVASESGSESVDSETRTAAKNAEEKKRSEARYTKYEQIDDINIDTI